MALKNVPAYWAERFPLINAVLFIVLFLVGFVLGGNRSLLDISGMDALGALAVVSFFFRLRVFDEYKDYDLDLQNHPQRVLQSGKVTLKELTALSLLGTAIEIIWSYYMGSVAFWAIALGYSLLMRYEFFVGKWLNRHLFVYSISHMLIMPTIIAWVWFSYSSVASTTLYTLMALSVLAGYSFELARKNFAPAAEGEGVDSYSKRIGNKAVNGIIVLLLTASLALQFFLFTQLSFPWYSLVLPNIVYLVCVFFYAKSQPADEQLRKAEKSVSLGMAIGYLSLLVFAL